MLAKEDGLEAGATVTEGDADVLALPLQESKPEDEAAEETQAAASDTDATGKAEEAVEGETSEETQTIASDVGTTEESEVVEAVAEVIEPQAEETVEGSEVEAEGETEVSEPQDDRAWYVIHCYSGHENKVKHNLEQRIETMQMRDQIFQVVIPTEDEIEVRDGKRRTVERRVFPGYILVQMILADDSWYVVRNTPGVTGFVGMGNEPTPLRSEEVQAIMRRMEAEAPKIKVTFKPGQKVRIIDGPFNEFIGVVDEIDMERAKVRVLVSFFGRETPVELDFLQVERT